MKLVLLPGMDGTGLLFQRLVHALPQPLRPFVHSYDGARCEGYDALLATLPAPEEPYVILGESFSGPLAVRRAADDARVQGVILSASFVRAPQHGLRVLAGLGRVFFLRPPPRVVVEHILVGPHATPLLLREVQDAIAGVQPEVLAHRLNEIARVDVSLELDALRCPLLYLQGAQDRLVPASVGERIARGPSRTLRVLDAGHLLLQSRPEQSATMVASFIEGLRHR